jgi:uncharacterized protein (TIGR02001 family)
MRLRHALREARSGGCEIVRLGAAAAWLAGIAFASSQACAGNVWGGSAALSSDYFVRGISRTSNNPALQLDLHYTNPNGFVAGAFASNAQIDPSEPRDVELSGFLGYVWNISEAWQGRVLASHYAYPWNLSGSHYNYDELDLDLAYRGWLHFSAGYSPNSPRFVAAPYSVLTGVSERSAEVSVQRQVFGKLSLLAGVGYSHLAGPESGGYTYMSAGAAYDLQSVTLALAYVNTSSEAKVLFYNEAAAGQWTGTVIWRF